MRLFALLLLFPLFISFQEKEVNLVHNGGFEEYQNCPTNIDNFYELKNWFRFAGSPNYFNCEIDKHPTDPNIVEVGKSHSGTGYIGFGHFDSQPGGTVEGFMQELKRPLRKGVGYRISFWMKSSKEGYYAEHCVSIGILGLNANPVAKAWADIHCPSSHEGITQLAKTKNVTNAQWQEYEVLFQSPAEFAYLGVAPVCSYPCKSYLFIDDLELREVPSP